MKYSKSKELNQIVRMLVREGWNFHRGGKHERISHPTSRLILTVSSSPSDWRTVENFLHQVRRGLTEALSSLGGYARSLVNRFSRLVYGQIVLASESMVGFREFGVCLELFKPDGATSVTTKRARMVKYAATCPGFLRRGP